MHLPGWFHPKREPQTGELNRPLVALAHCGAVARNEIDKSARERVRAAVETVGCRPRLLLAKDSEGVPVAPQFPPPAQQPRPPSTPRDPQPHPARPHATCHRRCPPRP